MHTQCLNKVPNVISLFKSHKPCHYIGYCYLIKTKIGIRLTQLNRIYPMTSTWRDNAFYQSVPTPFHSDIKNHGWNLFTHVLRWLVRDQE